MSRRFAVSASRDEIVHHGGRALLIGLHHEAEPLPAFERGIGRERFQKVERKLQAVRLLGIDIEADAIAGWRAAARFRSRG